MRRTIVAGAFVLATSNAYAQAGTEDGAPSHADDPGASPNATESPEILEAREAFRLGSTLAKQGRWSDALAAFEHSSALKEHPVTTYNLAYCARALGQFVRAYQSFQAALEPARGLAELPENFQTQARSYLVELKQRIAHATVTLGASTMTIRVDGRLVGALDNDGDRVSYLLAPEGALPVSLPRAFDLWLDPGNHVFVVVQPGVADVTRLYTFAPGTTEPLAFLARTPVAEHAGPRERIVMGKPDRTWAIVSLGVGAAGFVTSGVFAILSLNLKSTLESRCSANDVCSTSDAGDVDRVKRFADYTTAGLVAGGVATAVGAALWFTAKPHRESAHSAQLTPFIGIGSAGVTGQF